MITSMNASAIVLEARKQFLASGKVPYSARCGKELFSIVTGWDPQFVLTDHPLRAFKKYGLWFECYSTLGDMDIEISEMSAEEMTQQLALFVTSLRPHELALFVGCMMGRLLQSPNREIAKLMGEVRDNFRQPGENRDEKIR